MKWAMVTLILGYIAVWQLYRMEAFILPVGIILLSMFLFYLTVKRIRLLPTITAKLKVITVIVISTVLLTWILRYLVRQQLISIWYYPPIFSILVFSRRGLRKLFNLSVTEPRSFGVRSQTQRGEIVRSKAEKKVADWLYQNEIDYEYERKIDLPNGDTILSDFYLVDDGIYLEYWGLSATNNEVGETYRKRKREKISQYDVYGYDLISIYPHHLYELDEYLPQQIEKVNSTDSGFWNWLISLFKSDHKSKDLTKPNDQKLFCTNCGQPATKIGEFCVKCGTEIS